MIEHHSYCMGDAVYVRLQRSEKLLTYDELPSPYRSSKPPLSVYLVLGLVGVVDLCTNVHR